MERLEKLDIDAAETLRKALPLAPAPAPSHSLVER
jgi:hypothetical protein